MNNPNNPTLTEKEYEGPRYRSKRARSKVSKYSDMAQATGPQKTYAEKLKDPKWQKKRLEVLQAANWKCSQCGDGTKTLHVHHPKYVRGREPWEYDDLVSLCEKCHSEEHRESPKTTLEESTRSLKDHIALVEKVGLEKGGDFTKPYLQACRRCVFVEEQLLMVSQMLCITLNDPENTEARKMALAFSEYAEDVWGAMAEPPEALT